MILKVVVDDQIYPITVPEEIIAEGGDFFSRIDKDMDKGWQMSRTWVESPDLYQRCQIVADRILGAFHTENQKMVVLMSGYVLSRVPHIEEVVVDTTGDITLTEVVA